MLPSSAELPNDAYSAKKLVKNLGLGYEKIAACPQGCMLFWKDNANDEVCKICGKSQWKDVEQSNSNLSEKCKKKVAKILQWFPLKPRLQRLYMSSKAASSMRWHAESRTNDGIMRHLADSQLWKSFDAQYVEFSTDPRNVRLGLAYDGFNPFGNMNTNHSTWPVVDTIQFAPMDLYEKIIFYFVIDYSWSEVTFKKDRCFFATINR